MAYSRAMPDVERFAIHLQKENFKFSAAHFLIFPDGSKERLHGHNYRAAAGVEGALDENAYVLDFTRLKRALRAVVDRLDHKMLLPAESRLIRIERQGDHVQATYEMQTGQLRMGFPSVGAWVTYGLGSESSSLPAFVVMNDYRGGPLGGPNDWSAGFMPASYQGTVIRTPGTPILDLAPPEGLSRRAQRRLLDKLARRCRL